MLLKLIQLFSTFTKRGIQFLLSPRCLICGFSADFSANLCAHCHSHLPRVTGHCNRCATALPGASDHLTCGNCLTSPPFFNRVYTLFPYQTPIPALIMQLKFQHQLTHAQLFADLFLNAILTDWYQDKSLPDVIIPVPLHPLRLKERGFNQSLEIIKKTAKKLNIPLDVNGIVRIKNTVPQRHLSANERLKNMKNAFFSIRNYTDKKIAIVDDVITTGQTIRELSQILHLQGAKNIDVWCAARR